MAEALAVFEEQRSRLMSLAYQMLGELQAAEDVVQDTWLRWNASRREDIRSPVAWLSSVATRLAIDQLRSARHTREVYKGPWLPEPVMESDSGPADALALAQQCELALLWSMERLGPQERAAFLLRQVFDTSYADIAGLLERSEESTRQLVSRARKRLADGPRYDASPAELEQVMLDFAAAAASGDKAEVMRLLSPEVVAISDGGGLVTAALIPVEGRERVAQVATHIASGKRTMEEVELTRVNGRPALARLQGDDMDMIFTLRLDEQGLVCWIYTLRNPLKLDAVARRRH